MRNAAKWGVVLLASLGFLAAGCGGSSCPSHFKTCGKACVDIYTDPANCGACGKACAGGEVCSSGACGQSCPVGETACGGSCRDLQTDDANCGTCGTACNPGQHCTAGACACPPGIPNCGPTVLVYSDVPTFTYPTPPEAIAASARLKGSAIAPSTAGCSFAGFNAAYDAGGFDVVVWDQVNCFLVAPAASRLNDWVTCGGRLIINAFPIIYPAPSATLGTLLGITAASPYCTSTGPDKSIFPDKSAVDLWSQPVAVGSSLAPTQPNLWSPYCGLPYPMGYQLTPAVAGTIAGRFDTAGTGPGAIAVTRNGHVVVQAFNPSDYRMTDANADGVPDVQALYANEIAYVVKQGPPGLTCSSVETFDGVWPLAPWKAAGAAYGSTTAACAHDGASGFSETTGGNGPGLWYYRTDVTVGNPGQKLSMWIQTPSTASAGLFLLGFGSKTTGGWSFAALAGAGPAAANNLYFFNNTTWGTYTSVANVALTFATSTWYRMEVEFGSAGAVTGRLYGSDGMTVLGTLTTTLTGLTPGGVAIQVTGQGAAAACADTIKVY